MNSGKICVSVCAGNADEMINNIKRAEEFADIIELRFDCLPSAEIGKALQEVATFDAKVPMLVTFRPIEQGGKREITKDERREFWSRVPRSFWAGDFEEDAIKYSPDWIKKILSHHDFSKTTENVSEIYERLSSAGAAIIKIAVQAADITDSIPVWKLLGRAKAEKKQIIPIAMGEAGKWTRVLGLAHGAFMTYASLEAGKETADGQISAKDLVDTYRVKQLDEQTEVYGVIGDPVSQSLSPYMHNPAFVKSGVNAIFIPFLVKNLDEFIRRMVRPESREVELNFGGFSVTMPHKQAIMRHLDAIDLTAEKIGAVNTVKIHDGKLIGYNTDAHGFIAPLKAKFGSLRDARVAVFGAGGAARACVFALKEEGSDVAAFVRSPQKARSFGEEFQIKMGELVRADLFGFDIVVNATPLGMKGEFEHESIFSADQLKGVKFVYDLVTRPSDTPLIAEARKANTPAIGGLEMLIAQGAKQFEIWTGGEAPIDEMRESALARMRGNES